MTIIIGDIGGKGGWAEEGIYPPTYPIKKAPRNARLSLSGSPTSTSTQTLIALISYLTYKI